MNGSTAWATLIVSIGVYEYTCVRTGKPEQLLSRALDRGRASHPVANVAILGAIAATSLHLARIVPARWDVFSLLRIT